MLTLRLILCFWIYSVGHIVAINYDAAFVNYDAAFVNYVVWFVDDVGFVS